MQSEDENMHVVREVFNDIVKQTLSENYYARRRNAGWLDELFFFC